MIGLIIAILLILWFLGYITIPGLVIPNFILFVINGVPITLWNLLIFLVVLWLISLLPGIFRWIVGVIFLIWIFSIFGLLAIPGLASILVIAIIIGAIIALLGSI